MFPPLQLSYGTYFIHYHGGDGTEWVSTNFEYNPNKLPVANAGPDKTVTEGDTVAFDASGSTDPDGIGDIVSYNWNFGDSSTGTGVSPTHIYKDNGTYTATLTVEDSKGATDTDTVTITVNNAPPVVGEISSSATRIVLGESITLTTTGSFTDAGVLDTHSALWDFGEGTDMGNVTESNGNGSVNGSFVYTQSGTYEISLTVTDNDGDSGVSSNTITVDVVAPPTADAGSAQTITEGGTVQFDASGSTDPDGFSDIVSYNWGFGDGTIGTGVSPTHLYEDNGVYTAHLIVEDSQGETDSDTVTITVNNAPPVVDDITVSQTYFILGNPTTITANGSFTDAGVQDLHNAVWDFGQGTTVGTITEANGSGTVNGTFTYTVAGTYEVSLTVSDSDGGSGTSNTITVEVVEPTDAIEDLVYLVTSFNLQQGINNSLDSKLEAALNALIDVNINNDQAAINSLNSFINAVEAQRGNKITNEQADALIAAAQAVIDALTP